MLDAAACHAALEAKDHRFDGRFFVGVTSTGVYCRCVCPARTPKPENRTFHRSAAAAEKAGFRPCLLCRPEAAPGMAPIDAARRLAGQALSRIEAGALEERGLADLAAELGVTDRHLRRVVHETFGAAPVDLAQTHRLLTAKRLLTETNLSITEAAFASGFKSVRRFNALFLERYGFPPSRIRKRRNAAADGEGVTLELAARGPFDFAATLPFLEPRMIAGMETISDGVYRRTMRIAGRVGWMALGPSARGICVTLSDTLAPALRPLLAAIRGAFDLDTDVLAVDAMLADDPVLCVDVDPAVRLPGALDPFETTIRAILGQQVTIAAARTFVQRLTDWLGEPVEADPFGLAKLFPSPQAIAAGGAEALGARLRIPRARAQTLARVAEAAADGRLSLARGAWETGRAALATIPGIGTWTVEYVALRGLGDPDAFPAGDSAVTAALAPLGLSKAAAAARAETWRPWRGYAAARLWRAQFRSKKPLGDER
jgi:AraC family transcriptional regulator, regulatory protein of adaptative response / DNA-3-methyladenine glycosylase II